MRLDKFLKVTNLLKRRTVANEVADEGAIKVNGKVAKPSYTVKNGDIITIDLWNYEKVVKVIQVPEKNSIRKTEIDKYIEIVSYKTKSPPIDQNLDDSDDLF